MTIIEWLSKFKCEPLVIFLFVSYGLRVVSMQQLLQDKVCHNDFSQSAEYCKNIAEMPNSVLKTQIFDQYQLLLTIRTVIAFFVSNLIPLYLFVGGWCDKFKDTGRRYSLITIILINYVVTFFSILNVINMHWSSWTYLFLTITPLDDMTAVTVIYSYITAHTSESERAQRMLFLQVMFLFGIAIGIFCSGILFGLQVPFIEAIAPGQLHNALLPYGLAIILQTCALIWTLVVIKKESQSTPEDNAAVSAFLDTEAEGTSTVDEATGDTLNNKLSLLFDLDILKASFRAVIKNRPDNMKANMYWIVFVLCLTGFPTYGVVNSMFPLTQIIYKWNASVFTKYVTVSLILKPAITMIMTPILTKLLKFSDLQICLFGSVCIYLGCWAMGTIVHPAGYILNMIIGACSVCSSTGARSYLSKKIPSDEITKVYTFIQVVESIVPSLGSIAFTAIISYSSTFYPTLCFHVSCLVVLVAIFIVIHLDLSARAEIALKEKADNDLLADTVVSGVSEEGIVSIKTVNND